jgi:DNA repair protein RadC
MIFTNSDLYNVTEVQLIYKRNSNLDHNPKVSSSKEAYALLRETWDLNRIELLEQFKILLLNNSNICMGISDVSTGGVSSCIVDPRIVFATALKANAATIILAHNHPSGGLRPSESDLNLTKKLVGAGKLLNIDVVDHLIITPKSYYSMGDNGLML